MTHVSGALDEVEAKLSDDIILISKYLGDSACNPPAEGRDVSTPAEKLAEGLERIRNALFHNLQVDLLHVNLLVELRREFRALEELRIDSGRHGRSSLWYRELWS